MSMLMRNIMKESADSTEYVLDLYFEKSTRRFLINKASFDLIQKNENGLW